MFDIFKKGLLSGVGLGLMTKEKIEDLVAKTITEAKLSEEEGKKFLAKVLEQSDEAKHDIEEKIQFHVKEVVEKLNISTADKLKEMNDKLAALEKKINEKI